MDFSVSLPCPAKVNLTLAVTGRRADGFHELGSLVARIRFGDWLELQWEPEGCPKDDRVRFDGLALDPVNNTVLAAIRSWRRASGFAAGAFRVRVRKSIPVGAGLGGGSSNAASTLMAIRKLDLKGAGPVDWTELAAEVGSDVPLFLGDPVLLMEGRGERLRSVEIDLRSRIRGRPVVLFKPPFGIHTGEAYGRLAAKGLYRRGDDPAGLARWRASGLAAPPPGNDFERLLEHWMPSVPVVLDRLRGKHGLDARLSGSGSCCFAFSTDGGSDISEVKNEMRRAWGEDCWLERTYFE
jgi:4-diphosphocytidyl-2-C-methyl-D-erythritol kinase